VQGRARFDERQGSVRARARRRHQVVAVARKVEDQVRRVVRGDRPLHVAVVCVESGARPDVRRELAEDARDLRAEQPVETVYDVRPDCAERAAAHTLIRPPVPGAPRVRTRIRAVGDMHMPDAPDLARTQQLAQASPPV
jgi:hypothetical protein